MNPDNIKRPSPRQLANHYHNVIRKGREIDDHIFLSGYKPFETPEMALEPIHDQRYRNRSAHPEQSGEVDSAIRQWMRHEGLPEAKYDALVGMSLVDTLFVNLTKVVNPNDEINGDQKLFDTSGSMILPTPIYSLFVDKCYDNHLKVVLLPNTKENDYKPTSEAIAATLAAHPEAQALMLVNPSNPTGKALSEKEIDAIAQVITRHNQHRDKKLLVIVDETFQNLAWKKDVLGLSPAMHHMAAHPDLQDITITLNSLSKDWGPDAGFAFAYGPKHLMARISALEGTVPDRQALGAEILNELSSPPLIDKTRDLHHRNIGHYLHNYDCITHYIDETLNPALQKVGLGTIRMMKPDAGFNVFLDCSGLKDARTPSMHKGARMLPGKRLINSSGELVSALLKATGVVVYPGEMFYAPGEDMMLRISLGLDTKKTLKAFEKIKDFCLSLTPPEKTPVLSR